jgi:hypothetical protein
MMKLQENITEPNMTGMYLREPAGAGPRSMLMYYTIDTASVMLLLELVSTAYFACQETMSSK